jgi:hypothetical protein
MYDYQDNDDMPLDPETEAQAWQDYLAWLKREDAHKTFQCGGDSTKCTKELCYYWTYPGGCPF